MDQPTVKYTAFTIRYFPKDLRQQLKILAARRGMPMNTIVIDLIRAEVRKEQDYDK